MLYTGNGVFRSKMAILAVLEEKSGGYLRMGGVKIRIFGALEGGRERKFHELPVDAGLGTDLQFFVGSGLRGDKRYAEGVLAVACVGLRAVACRRQRSIACRRLRGLLVDCDGDFETRRLPGMPGALVPGARPAGERRCCLPEGVRCGEVRLV